MINFSSTSHCNKRYYLIFIFVTIAGLFYWYLPGHFNGDFLPSILKDKTSSFQAPFTIIALGDSLTEGFFRHDSSGSKLVNRSFHPYTIQLEKRLPVGKKFKVINSGISGERLWSMKKRLEIILKDFNMQNGIIIILGGTNDCLDIIRNGKNNYTVEKKIKDTVETIIEMHKLCQKNNVLSVIMTIPPVTRGEWFEVFNNIRNNINRELTKFSSKYNKSFIFVDFGKFVDSLLDDTFFWDDGLHYSPYGYEIMGNFIFEQIKDKI